MSSFHVMQTPNVEHSRITFEDVEPDLSEQENIVPNLEHLMPDCSTPLRLNTKNNWPNHEQPDWTQITSTPLPPLFPELTPVTSKRKFTSQSSHEENNSSIWPMPFAEVTNIPTPPPKKKKDKQQKQREEVVLPDISDIKPSDTPEGFLMNEITDSVDLYNTSRQLSLAERTHLGNNLVTFMYKFSQPPFFESELRNLTVHALVQVIDLIIFSQNFCKTDHFLTEILFILQTFNF